MAKIFPFKGILYNRKEVQDISLVTAPPYDVISKAERDECYKKHEYNIIRLILGMETPDDTPANSKYTRAACFLRNWRDEEVLVEDNVPCIYPYTQEYNVDGKRKEQGGFICVLRLEEFSEDGGVLPHEETLNKPKEDRLSLMEACQANLSPIFGLYSDPDFSLSGVLKNDGPPLMDVRDANGVVHKLSRVHDAGVIQKAQALLRSKKVYIADGHHRYETAIAYREKRRSQEKNFTGDESYNHIMVYLVNMDSSGLTILPAHRLVRMLPKDSPNGWENKLDEFFARKDCSSFEDVSGLMKKHLGRDNAFGMYRKGRLQLLVLKDGLRCNEVTGAEVSEIYKSLDVTIVHRILLNHILGGGMEMSEDNISYVKDGRRALKLVDEGEFDLAVLLNPTKIEQVKAIASMGRRMPGKATYFYPKPLSGLVINKLSSKAVV